MSSISRSHKTIPIDNNRSTRLSHWIRKVRINISLHDPRFCHGGCWGCSLSSIRGGCIRMGFKAHVLMWVKQTNKLLRASNTRAISQPYISETYTEVVTIQGVFSIILRVCVRAQYAHCCFKPSMKA